MKKIITIVFTVTACLSQLVLFAQVKIGLYGTRINSVNSIVSPDLGRSASISFYTVGDTLGKKKIDFPLVAQFGAECYYSGLGKRTFYDVPLLGSQMGFSKVILSNSLFCVNFLTRFSLPNKSIFTPYAEVLAGYRVTRSNLEITPYLTGSQQTKTRQMLSTVDGINYGMGLGVMVSLSKCVQLDLGVSYAQAAQNGGIANLSSAYADANGINLDLKESPDLLRVIHVGLIFYFKKSSVAWNKPSGNTTPSYQNYYYNYYVPVRGHGIVSGIYCSPYFNSRSGYYRNGYSRNYGSGRNYGVSTGGIKGSVPMGGGGNFGSTHGGSSNVGVHIGGGHSGGRK